MNPNNLLRGLLALVLLCASVSTARAGIVTAGLVEEYIAGSANNGGVSNGQAVSVWTNLGSSGTAGDLTSTITVQQPTYSATGLNGQPTLVFNGGQVLSNLVNDAVPDNSSRTVIIVASSPSGVGGTLMTNRTTAPVNTDQRYAGGVYLYSDGIYTNATTGTHLPHVPFIDTHVETNSGVTQPTNGTSVGTLSTQLDGHPDTVSGPTVLTESNGGAGFSIGDRYDAFYQGWVGDISAVLIYNRALTPAELFQTGQFLAAQYGTAYAPEPSSIALGGIGLAGLLAGSARRITRRRGQLALRTSSAG